MICQCCGLPFTPRLGGTNRDQSKNSDYCIDCFKDGVFTDPHLSIQDMEKKLLDMARHHDGMSIEEAEAIIKMLPDLKRWKMSQIL